MNMEEVKEVIKKENLSNYSLFNQDNPKENEVGIAKDNNSWKVYARNERATEEGVRFFDNENDALDSFVKRLRASKALDDLKK